MSERLAEADGGPGDDLFRLYARFGAGGAGLLFTGNVMVDSRAIAEGGNVVVEDATHMERLRRWADVARAGGARVLMQINHPGRQSPRFVSKEPVAPSAVPMRGTGGMFRKPRALEDSEIREIIAETKKLI